MPVKKAKPIKIRVSSKSDKGKRVVSLHCEFDEAEVTVTEALSAKGLLPSLSEYLRGKSKEAVSSYCRLGETWIDQMKCNKN